MHHVNPRVLQMLEFLDDCSHKGGRLVARFRLARRSRAGTKDAPKLLVHKAIHKVRRKSVDQMLEPCQTMRRVLERLRAEGTHQWRLEKAGLEEAFIYLMAGARDNFAGAGSQAA